VTPWECLGRFVEYEVRALHNQIVVPNDIALPKEASEAFQVKLLLTLDNARTRYVPVQFKQQRWVQPGTQLLG
jgi:hypothetical protein